MLKLICLCSILFFSLWMCNHSNYNIDVQILSKETMVLSNYTSDKYYVPISQIDTILPIISHLRYKVVNCEVKNIESVSSELVMFTKLDTLMPNETKEYKLNLFDSSISMRYDSQLIYKFEIYDEKSFSNSSYNSETSEKILIISYRDNKGKLIVTPLANGTLIENQMDKISFNVCDR